MLLTNPRSTMGWERSLGDTSLRIAVNAASTGEANRLTAELEQWLKGRVEDLELVRVKENAETQDAGTILVAVLAAPAMVEFAKGPALELAKGIADWLRKRRATVTIGIILSILEIGAILGSVGSIGFLVTGSNGPNPTPQCPAGFGKEVVILASSADGNVGDAGPCNGGFID